MTVDLSQVDAANRKLQADLSARVSTRVFGGAVTAALHAMNTAPAPTPTPVPPAAGSLTGPWFLPSAAVNTPIPASLGVDPNSARWITALFNTPEVQRAGLYMNAQAWTTTVYHANASTPTVVVDMSKDGVGYVDPSGARHFRPGCPYQPSFVPSPDSDAHLTVICDVDLPALGFKAGDALSFQGFDPVALTAHAMEVVNVLTGTGGSSRPDAGIADLPVPFGLILPRDIHLDGTPIGHALRCDIPISVHSSGFRSPANRSDGAAAGMIPSGALIRLDPALSVAGLSGFQLSLARTLQIYGTYVGDQGGSFAVYAECTADGTSYPAPLAGLPASWVQHMQVMSGASGVRLQVLLPPVKV